ncbi:MAG: UV DNA damage repair endonuclease UvsE [Trueperaceae bacterium]|nr:UV DNA damage repair endonuclease UvsE [Trueperaceae bacterium]
MRVRHLGYVGQNLTLGLTTGRTLRLANLGGDRLDGVIASNLESLARILEWNVRHDIRFFRIASSVIPFASHPAFEFDWRTRFAEALAAIERYVLEHDLRLSMHPGQYTVLNSPDAAIVRNAVAELEFHTEFLDVVSAGSGTITLHVGGAYGDRERAKERLIANARRLSSAASARLTLENDDRIFDADDALEVAEALGVPMVFDLFHHRCLHRRAGWRDDVVPLVERAVETWGPRVPKLHLSSARTPGESAHAEYVDHDDLRTAIELIARIDGDGPVDLMLEAKAKERAVLLHQATLRDFVALR